jgi:hypothetical protein
MISGFFLKKKPPHTQLNRAHELENCSKREDQQQIGEDAAARDGDLHANILDTSDIAGTPAPYLLVGSKVISFLVSMQQESVKHDAWRLDREIFRSMFKEARWARPIH